MKYAPWLISLFMLIVIHSACSQSNNENTANQKQASLDNKVMINLHAVIADDPSLKPFPLMDSIWLPLASANSSSGSYTALRFYFEKADSIGLITLEVFLPSAPKFLIKPNRNGNVSLDVAAFPYTLNGTDYLPFKNALYDTPIKPFVNLSVTNTTTKQTDWLTFDIEEITVSSYDCENNKINAAFLIYLITDQTTNQLYGLHAARIEFIVKDFSNSIMMVD